MSNTVTIANQIIEVLEYLCSKFGIAFEWSQETMLPLVKDIMAHYITWEIWSSTVWIIISIIVFAINLIYLKKIAKKLPGMRWIDGRVRAIYAIVVCSIFMFIAIAIIIVQALDITKCLTFPELQAFEYISSLMKMAK